jgi:hypothetical protein
MRGAVLPLAQYVFMAWCLVKHRDNFEFYVCGIPVSMGTKTVYFILYSYNYIIPYEGVSKSFRTGRQEPELQMVQLSATRCSCIASQRVFIIVRIQFVIDSVRKLLDTPSYLVPYAARTVKRIVVSPSHHVHSEHYQRYDPRVAMFKLQHAPRRRATVIIVKESWINAADG